MAELSAEQKKKMADLVVGMRTPSAIQYVRLLASINSLKASMTSLEGKEYPKVDVGPIADALLSLKEVLEANGDDSNVVSAISSLRAAFEARKYPPQIDITPLLIALDLAADEMKLTRQIVSEARKEQFKLLSTIVGEFQKEKSHKVDTGAHEKFDIMIDGLKVIAEHNQKIAQKVGVIPISGTITSGRKTSTTIGTAVSITTDRFCRNLKISALPTNTSAVYVGGSNTLATAGSEVGIALSGGGFIEFVISDPSLIYLDVLTSGDGVTYSYES